MKPYERNLLSQLNSNADSFDDYFENADTNAKVVPLIARAVSKNAGTSQIGKVAGNPTFSSQFDVNIQTVFFTQDVATGLVWAQITAAALLAAVPGLATRLTAFLFGYSDYTSGYANAASQFPLAGGWTYAGVKVVGKDDFPENLAGSNFDAIVNAQFRQGDVIIKYKGTAPAASQYWGYVILRCTQVAYATLLNAMASDRFIINNIRYIQNDTTPAGLNQYTNDIALLQLSLFGKMNKDFVSPNSFKEPKNFQNGIIDVPIKKGLDKQETLATYINYDAVNLQWSIFVWTTIKI